MSVHIEAEPGDIAETVLLPGDPLRAEFVAKEYLSDVKRYNSVRNMFGFTGTYEGKRVSVQGTGMGQPSLAIYVHELIESYDVQNLIRIGSCGAMQPDIELMDLIFALGASTDSSMNRIRFEGQDFAPVCDFGLLQRACEAADARGYAYRAGGILSSDSFYTADPDAWKLWASYGVLAVEMETSALYTLAAKAGRRALSMLTVSDSLVTGDALSSEQRQTSFRRMVETALSLA
jgi:purine-nucleoside phosphorylase